MAKVADQFETAPRHVYSGSYTTDYFLKESTIFKRRQVVYSSVNAHAIGLTGYSIANDRFLGVTSSLASFASRIILEPIVESTVAGRVASPSVRKFRTETEIFADSVLPAPPDIILKNGGQFVEGDDYSATGPLVAPQETLALLKEPRHFKIILGTSRSVGAGADPGPCSLTSSTDGSQVSDDVWAFSFPFENRYAGLDRFVSPGFNKTYNISLTQSVAEANPSFGIDVKSMAGVETPFTGSLYTLQYIHRDARRTDRPMQQAASLITTNIAFASELPVTGFDSKSRTPSDIHEILRGFYGFYSGGPDGGGNRSRIASLISFSETNERTNPGKFPAFFGDTPPVSKNIATKQTHLDYGVIVNGWKQGVYHGSPQKSFCYFRYNRFGQLRDLLEQRPDTKYHDITTGVALASPVKTVFVSGSDAFVTASRPGELNPNVSGIYDLEGKMGKPFDDSPSGSI